MKTISIAEFETLAARNDWVREQKFEYESCFVRDKLVWDEETRSYILVETPYAMGLASKTSTIDGIKITYAETFDYDEGDADSLSYGTEGQSDDVWSVEGLVVVDEDGKEISAHYLADDLSSDFSSIDYSVLEIEEE